MPRTGRLLAYSRPAEVKERRRLEVRTSMSAEDEADVPLFEPDDEEVGDHPWERLDNTWGSLAPSEATRLRLGGLSSTSDEA